MNKILIIDDEVEICQVLGESLREDGYEVYAASNGEEGVRKVEMFKPDLIILDVMMPKMDGVKVYEKLRGNQKTKQTPVIFLTALKTREDDLALGHDVGTYVIFSKPFDYDELLGTVRELLSRKG